MKSYLKFLQRLPKQLRERSIRAVFLLGENKLTGLDIKPLKGQKDVFKCRIGKIRIIYRRVHGENIVLDIGFRGGIYG